MTFLLVILSFKNQKLLCNLVQLRNFRKYTVKMAGAEAGAEAGAKAGAEIFDKLEPELHKNRPAPQHWLEHDLELYV
jgi:hypothetical protein